MTAEPDTMSRSRASISLSEFDLEEFETVERSATIRCATGHRSRATWRGTPVAALVEVVDLSLGTTHLCFESDDGYRACLDIHTALESMLAVARDGTALDAGERPRLVSPGVEGVRTVKAVSEIDPVSLSRNEDPEGCEAFHLGEENDA